MDYDVAIAGAGPAGVSCAVALVRKDPSLKGRVVLFDRARFPRSKPCGGGLTGHADEAMRALGLELTVPHLASPNATVSFGTISRAVRLQRPVKIVRREEFDASLVAQARDLGIEVREATPVEGFCADASGVSFGAGGRTHSARVLVGADGVGSAGARAAPCTTGAERRCVCSSPGPARPHRLGARHHALRLLAHGRGLRGYVWLFPVAGGLRQRRRHALPSSAALSGADLTALLARHLQRFGVHLDAPARGWPAWGYTPSASVSAQRLLLCGDAAGIDALTGEGIAVGLEEGPLVARAIVAALASGDFAFQRYARDVRRAIVGRELALDGRLASMLYAPRASGLWLSLIMFDERMQQLYAARVSGSEVLADRKRDLLAALGRHVFHAGESRCAATPATLRGRGFSARGVDALLELLADLEERQALRA